jgi:hypothetical protein
MSARIVFLAGLLCLGLLSGGTAQAVGPLGSATGQIVALGGGYIQIREGRTIANFVVPTPFFAVYLADKSHAAIENLALGQVVRVAYHTTDRGLLVAREIDILST